MRRLFIVPWLAAACATAPPSPPPAAAPPTPMVFGGSVISATPDAELDTSTYDDADLFHAAAEAERVGNRGQARLLYARLIHDMPTSALLDAAHFNTGLSFEHDHDYVSAAASYLPIIAAPIPSDADQQRTWIDAHFRRAACLAKSGEWVQVASIFDRVLAIADLIALDRAEALLGRGIAFKEQGINADAESAFGQVLHLARAGGRDSEQLRELAAEAAFQSAEIAHERFTAVTLAFPTELLAKRLEEKCELLMTAQTRYVRAIQFGDAHTVAAAGNRIGGMYERLYDDLIGLEVPADLTAEEIEVYRDEVKRRVRVLAEKAIRIYERTVLIGKRADSAAVWVQKSEAALARLRAIYLNDDVLSALH